MKCIVLALIQIRTGVLLLGPAACGKSTVVRVLKEAVGGLAPDAGGGRVQTWEIFPKVRITPGNREWRYELHCRFHFLFIKFLNFTFLRPWAPSACTAP